MLRMEEVDIFEISRYEGNAKIHPPEQIEEIAASILEFEFNDPLAIDENKTLITGHGTHEALQLLVSRGYEDYRRVSCVILSHMSPRQKQAYILAHNRIAQNGKWDFDKLSDQINELVESDFDVSLLGWNEQELDGLLKIDESILPTERAVEQTTEPEPEIKEKRVRAKSKVLHTCPHCNQEFTA